ncbi:MAG: hypothetical protein WAM27_04140 [Nitrososphaeraceae archaeon]
MPKISKMAISTWDPIRDAPPYLQAAGAAILCNSNLIHSNESDKSFRKLILIQSAKDLSFACEASGLKIHVKYCSRSADPTELSVFISNQTCSDV